MVVEKVQSRLRAMGANLSKERLQQWTDKLSKGFTEESTDEEINDFVDGFKDLVVEQARQDDRIRSLENQPKAKDDKPKVEDKVEEPKDETPAWAKALLEKVEQLETAKVQESLFDKFKKDERNKNIPTALLQTLAPKTADEYETAVENINNIALEFNKNSIIDTTPPTSTGNATARKLTEEYQRMADNI